MSNNKWDIEFGTWNTDIRGIPVTVYDDGGIEFDCEEKTYLSIPLIDLQKFISKVQSFIYARLQYKEKYG